ncbi:MAG: MarR family winged helix-turn-helix transcriptional regulator [Clostridia bacterium]
MLSDIFNDGEFVREMGDILDILLMLIRSQVNGPIQDKARQKKLKYMDMKESQRSVIAALSINYENIYKNHQNIDEVSRGAEQNSKDNIEIGLNMNTLSSKTNLSYNNLYKIVDELMNLDYVERHNSLIDRRQVLVNLTENGRKMLDEFDKFSYLMAEKLFLKSLTQDEKVEMRSLSVNLIKIMQKINPNVIDY